MTAKKQGGASAPSDKQRFASIRDWEKKKAALKKAQAEELTARMLVGEEFFTARAKNQTEGSETATVEGVWKMTWKQPYNYTVDEVALEAVKKELLDNKIDPDTLFRYKPSLKMDAYREADETTLLILSQAVESKPGTPQLEITYAKAKGEAGKKAGRKGAA